MRCIVRILAAIAALGVISPTHALAEGAGSYPDKPVKIIAP